MTKIVKTLGVTKKTLKRSRRRFATLSWGLVLLFHVSVAFLPVLQQQRSCIISCIAFVELSECIMVVVFVEASHVTVSGSF
jgi:hypothetical protein